MKVFIHIGPPKTGTSEIQNWLHNNRAMLSEREIYYPDHIVDKNGVSSGNVRSLFHRRESCKPNASSFKTFIPITDSRKRLMEEATQNNCNTLLLSSEVFFLQLHDVMAIFPEAILIAYVRFPLDVMESIYNQSIKRHGNSDLFFIPPQPRAIYLEPLSDYVNQFGIDKFILRPFMKSCFVDGELISDFLSTIGLQGSNKPLDRFSLKTMGMQKKQLSRSSPLINRSYCFEAQEFKRWLNNFDLTLLQAQIDTFMQRYRNGTLDYSLLEPDQYAHLKDHFLNITRSFILKNDVKNGNAFLRAVEQQQQKPFKRQMLSVQEFNKIAHALRQHDTLLVRYLSVLIESCGKPELVNSPYAKALGVEAKRAKQDLDQVNEGVIGLSELRDRLKIPETKNNVIVYRDVAIFCEKNGELKFALRLMKAAQAIHPNGPWIKKKIAEYEDKLSISIINLNS